MRRRTFLRLMTAAATAPVVGAALPALAVPAPPRPARPPEIIPPPTPSVLLPALGDVVRVSLHSDLHEFSEVSGGGYARRPAVFTSTGSGSIHLAASVDFSDMPMGAVESVGLWNDQALLAVVPLDYRRVVMPGDTLRLTGLTLSID